MPGPVTLSVHLCQADDGQVATTRGLPLNTPADGYGALIGFLGRLNLRFS